MLKILLTLLCFINLLLFAQVQAWYVGERHGADLLLVDMKGDSCYKRQALMFNDSVREVKRSSHVGEAEHMDWMPWVFNVGHQVKFPPASAVLEELHGGIPMSYTVVDSLEVDGKWYLIHQHMTDDGWIGGRPNAVHQHIAVSDLGIIYSYENWIDAHLLFMFCHEDPAKQRVLQCVFKHLETTNGWQPWKKITAMANRYSFEICLEQLTGEWMATRNHIQLVSANYENIGQEIQANITIKNTSAMHYAFPLYFTIAPSAAMIHYPDTTMAWDLLETYSGQHMKQMYQEVYLAPGEQVSFSYIFRMEYGCGHCTKATYDGFQVYTLRSYLDWLLQDPETRAGNEYFIYPHREIRPVE
jgi:hypothetical protein